ncbi:hypothetical protein BKA69DRAFT_1040611 [Paraphysoderma sedebokerense]|nr:hypothetical protein BKA69DRAFT_1040611 [Paraphysoderma sedebokerense]
MGFATITVNFIQMIIVLRDIKLNWTPEFHLVLNSISFLNFNVELTSPECFILDEPINFSLKLRLTLAIPLLLFGILAVIALYNSMTILRLKNRYVPAIAKILKFKFVTLDEVSMQKKHTESVFRILRGFNAILLFVYVTVASKSLAFFDCTKMSDGNYYLDADPSLRCNEGEAWRQADMPIAVLGVLLLYQTQKSGPTWTRAKETCKKLVSQNSYMKPQFQYFLLVQIIQKLFVIVVKQFFTNYVALQIVLTIALAVFGYGVYSKYHPYAYMSLNYLEIQSVISSAIILALGLLLYTNQFPHDDQKMVITALLLALVFGFLLSVIVAIVHELHQAGKEKYGNLSNAVTAMKQTLRRASLVVKTTRTSPQSQVVRQAEIKESEEAADPSVA